jgi:DNA polymerase III delta prime subunit/very-short-patch-repair endonuclease
VADLNIRTELDRFRTRLLDLTLRSPLIKYRGGRTRSITVVDELPDQMYDHLVRGKRAFQFQATGIPVGDSTRQGAAIELPGAVSASRHLDNKLQVAIEEDLLEARLRSVHAFANSEIDETGGSSLHLAIGFLEWYESSQSNEAIRAPLLLIPVAIQKDFDQRRQRYTFSISHSEEDVQTNLSLAEKLLREFQLNLPDFDEDLTPEKYFTAVRDSIRSAPRWTVRREAVLGFFAFAKLLMYRDLDPANWNDEDLEHKPLVRAVFEGTESDSADAQYGDEYDLDSFPDARDMLLPLDADSSQHSAVYDVSRGHSLVIEGPPGTGKSQTITNIIAHSLSQGKTVLFVAEKMAALDVVRSNLAKIGFDDLCLEMHSHRRRPAEVYASLASRLRKRFSRDGSVNGGLSELQDSRTELEEYLKACRVPAGPSGEPLWHVFWRIAALRGAGAVSGQPTAHFGINEAALKKRLGFFREMALHLHEIGRPDSHPWRYLHASRYYAAHRPVLEAALTRLASAARVFEEVSANTGVEVSDWPSLEWVRGVSTEPLQLARPTGLLQVLCTQAAHGALVATLRDAISLCAGLSRVRAVDIELWEHATHQPSLDAAQRICALADGNLPLAAVSLDCNPAALRQTEAELEGARQALQQLDAPIASAVAAGHDPPRTPEQLDHLTTKVGLICDHVCTNPDLFRRDLFFPATSELLRQAEGRFQALTERRESLGRTFLMDDLPCREEIDRVRSQIRAAGTGLFRWLDKGYRTARRSLRLFQQASARSTPKQLIAALDELVAYLKEAEEFATDSTLARALGGAFRGMHSDWNGLRRATDWAQATMAAGLSFDAVCRLRAARDSQTTPVSPDELEFHSASLRQSLGSTVMQRVLGAPDAQATLGLDDIGRRCDATLEFVREIRFLLDRFNTKPFRSFSEVSAYMTRVVELDKQRRRLAQSTTCAAMGWTEDTLGVTNWSCATATADWIESLERFDLADPVKRWLLQADTGGRCDELSRRLDLLPAAIREWDGGLGDLRMLGDLDRRFTSEAERGAWRSWRLAITSLREQADSLLAWAGFCRGLDEAHALGLSSFISGMKMGTESADQARNRYELSFYESLAAAHCRRTPALATFSRHKLENARAAFQTADRELIRVARKHLAALAAERHVPEGVSTGRVRELTELALIRNEVNKVRAHCKLRQLMIRAAGAVQALKPCFMMSPISVAQYLASGYAKFDLVVMDEASQIRPADAIGAIARGSQVVIVGDPKQLPPTSFFEKSDADEESTDDATIADEGQSVLDVALKAFRKVRRLRWHYRSQHESLIAFSNKHFYDDDLIVFPSSTARGGELGLRHHYLADGLYAGRRNLREADEIARAIARHLIASPTDSLGVGTFNGPQRDLIEERLEALCLRDNLTREAVDAATKRSEGLFIKNLENLQGDERDVIYISYTYGPEQPGGPVAQRFGPITGEDGWRRLNVLVTRARMRLEVFASLRSEQIHDGPGKSRGVNAMKQFLRYAETGRLGDAQKWGPRSPDSYFEEVVGRVVERLGFQWVPQIGVAGYFIDLGVLARGRDDEFILGIECDGAAYHSSKFARDRDRLREEIIRLRGWHLHRIWSTDWFLNQPVEVTRLEEALQAAHKRWQASHERA